MKEIFKKFINLILVAITLFNTVSSPLTALAAEQEKGDLRLIVDGETQYVKNNDGSVSAIEGNFTNPGDVQVRKTVKKIDDNGNYEVIFEARGKRTSELTTNTGDIYAVIVFDRSNSMKNNTKWTNAKTAAKNFATNLHNKYTNANIAMVTFGSEAQIRRQFSQSDFTGMTDDDLFGYQPYSDYDTSGGTNLQAGLEAAYNLLNEKPTNSKKYVLVISDGKPTYYMNNNGTIHADGTTTTKTNLDKTLASATTLKGIAEVFTIGYDLPSGTICNQYPYQNYTAETVLKNVASKESNYYASNVSDITSVINNVLSQTTVYSPAATNLVITDNIGTQFTSQADTNNDGVMQLTLSKTTIEDSDAWQEVGRFTITIDKDSKTAWHQTNNNFTYTYDELTSPITSTKNPEVYWVQPKYSYSIEYYYDGIIDNSKTVSGEKYKDEKVSVTDTDIQANLKEGYKFSTVNPNMQITIRNNGENVIRVYYIKDNFDYTIFHVEKDNETNVLGTDTGSAEYESSVNVVAKSFVGYEYDSKSKENIVIDVENNIAYVYYTRSEYNYTIYHVEKDNETNVLGTDTGSAEYESLVNVVAKSFDGYTYDSKSKETIVIDVENNIAYVYYTRNSYKYTVEYYKENLDGEFDIVEEDTIIYEDVLFESEVIYEIKEYDDYTYNDSKTENSDALVPANNDLVVRLYYSLNDGNVVVHYVVKVEDRYIPFIEYARDEFGNKTPDFKDVELEDDILTGKIGKEFTTVYREVLEYNFIGIYEGNILENSDLVKVDEKELTSTFEGTEKEYTYVYEMPLGDGFEELPPQTGVEMDMDYSSYILLICVAYILRKYFKLISVK